MMVIGLKQRDGFVSYRTCAVIQWIEILRQKSRVKHVKQQQAQFSNEEELGKNGKEEVKGQVNG